MKKHVNWRTMTLNPLEMEELLIWYYWTIEVAEVPSWVKNHPLWPPNNVRKVITDFGITDVFNDTTLKMRVRLQMAKMEKTVLNKD